MVRKISILGGGESGTGAAFLAKQKGYEVFLSDNNKIADKYKETLQKLNIEWEEGKHSFEKIAEADEIITSPGIPDDAEIIKYLKKSGKKIISEIEFAARFTNAKKICITGSNGKTTTTELIYHILKKAKLKVGIAGNIGKSFAMQVAKYDYDYFVIELSSFQLDYMFDFKADIAILLNITPDHMNRYENNFDLYANSKFRIMQNQDSNCYFLYNYDDEVIKSKLNNTLTHAHKIPFSVKHKLEKGGYSDNTNIIITYKNELKMSISDISLQGEHNVSNSLAASISAKVLNIKNPQIRESLADFEGVEHRLERYIKVRGTLFINDSKSTNVNSSWYALQSIRQRIIWIAGGVDKGNDYSVLKDLVKEKVAVIIGLGIDNSRIIEAFGGIVDVVEAISMEDAVDKAYSFADRNDVVLLSPACASFDLFKNYEDRGKQFKEAVRKL